jgi:Family of unknown function (DUF6161)
VNAISNPVLSIDLSDGAQFRFATIAEIAQWLEKEQSAFGWLIEGGPQAGAGVSGLRNTFVNSANTLRQQLNQWQSAPENETYKEQFANTFRSAYSASTSVRSGHQFARIAADIAAKDGAVAASAAFGTLLGIDSQLNFQTIKGIIAAALKQAGIDPKSPAIVATAIADLNSSASTDRAKIVAQWSGLSEQARVLLERTDNSFKNQTDEFASRSAEMRERINESVNASIKSIEGTEAAYKEQMNLQASVEYWGDKATRHRKAIAVSRLILLLFTVVGTAALLAAFLWITTTAVEVADKAKGDTAVYLKFAAIGAIVTTIIFWVGRVLLRIYLSDRHLLTDAEERVAMVKTYLALTNEGKLEPADRTLVLAPLFRSAADGIVKDDGPDASLAGIIAKAIDVKGR